MYLLPKSTIIIIELLFFRNIQNVLKAIHFELIGENYYYSHSGKEVPTDFGCMYGEYTLLFISVYLGKGFKFPIVILNQ